MPASQNLNQRGLSLVEKLVSQADTLRVAVQTRSDGGRTIDCGIHVPGGLEAGRMLARICLAGLAEVRLVPARCELPCDLEAQVVTDHPVAACMASQYAGWQIAVGKYFAMGSGPMRAAAGIEALYDAIGHRETSNEVVGVLETRQFPPGDAVDYVAKRCGVEPRHVTLLLAPTASLAGAVQIVTRSVETALHKMHELGFDLARVVSGAGSAPLPPVAKNDLAAIGRTNDAILYGGRVSLWVRGDDHSLATIGPKIPSSASPAYGEPFATIFEKAGRDFYKIDPQLFSPAEVTLLNVETGNGFRFGGASADVLERSFYT
jgi:methenyltetrahydromethanopterin cyclohydrolase